MPNQRVVTGTQGRKKAQQVAVKKTGHPAAHRKIRCPSCSVGICVQDNVDPGLYKCMRCGKGHKSTVL